MAGSRHSPTSGLCHNPTSRSRGRVTGFTSGDQGACLDFGRKKEVYRPLWISNAILGCLGKIHQTKCRTAYQIVLIPTITIRW